MKVLLLSLIHIWDMTRETSPLKQADDAVLLDSSDMTIDEVVDRMKQLVKEA